jgi:hypothetical protein
MFGRTHRRAARYRRLASMECDEARAALLRTLADEAERGVLCVPAHAPLPRVARKPQDAAGELIAVLPAQI